MTRGTDPIEAGRADLAELWTDHERLVALLPKLHEGADRSLELALSALELADRARAGGANVETIAELEAHASKMERSEASMRAEAERLAEEVASFAQDLQYMGHTMTILADARERILAGEMADDANSPEAKAMQRRIARLRVSVAANRRARAALTSENEAEPDAPAG